MTPFEKTKEVIEFVFTAASTVIGLIDAGKKIAPDVKNILSPFIESCRKIAALKQNSKSLLK